MSHHYLEWTKWDYFMKLVVLELQRNKNWRYGQAVFNALHKFHKDIAEEIRGTIIDTFHNDNNVEKLKEFLIKEKGW